MDLEGGTDRGGGVRRLMRTSPQRRCRPVQQAMSLEQLNTWLNTLDPPARVEGASMLDGYLTAIVIGPCCQCRLNFPRKRRLKIPHFVLDQSRP